MKYSSYRRLVSWRLLNNKEDAKRSLKGAEELLRDLCLSPDITLELWWIISHDQEIPIIDFWIVVHAPSAHEADRIGSLFESDCASHKLSAPIERHELMSWKEWSEVFQKSWKSANLSFGWKMLVQLTPKLFYKGPQIGNLSVL